MPGFAFGFGEGFDAVLGEQNFLPFQKLGDGQDLEARVAARKILGFVETGRCGFDEHRLGWLAHGDESADGGFVPRQHALQVADVVHTRVSALHLHDHLLGLAALVVKEIDVTVDAAVRAFLVVPGRPGGRSGALPEVDREPIFQDGAILKLARRTQQSR